LTWREGQRLLRLLGLAAALAALLGLAYLLDVQPAWQAAASDVFFGRDAEPSTRIAIVGMDARSHQVLVGNRPTAAYPREVLGALLDRLSAAGARVVVFDLLFELETPEDAVLADALDRAGNVVLAAVGEDPQDPGRRPAPITYAVLAESLLPFVARAAGEGHANIVPDRDGVVRRLPLLVQHADREVPALALAAVARYLRRPAPLDGPLEGGRLPFAGREIPVDDLYQVLVNYAGGPSRDGRGAFPVLSLVDVLDGTADLAAVRDRIVFVGPWSTRFSDEREGPNGTLFGVEIHANAAETLLRGAFLVPAPRPLTLALIALLAGLVALLVWRLRPLWAGLGALALLAAYFVVASEAFQRGTILNMLYPPLAVVVTFVGLTAYQLVFEQAARRALRRVLNRYLSPAVAEAVARDPERLELGGELRTMTVLFSDIRGFTTLSEQLAPRDLVALLNEYLTAMVAVLFRHAGVLDKYMGDAIMAFWNAPLAQPDHAHLACATALEMGAALDRLRGAWQARGVPPLDIGIGINTGPMVFGNMGSPLRTDFTVLGDSVNLASRLEGLNKEYGTRLIVGAATREAVGDAYRFRYLDLVAVKGKREPVAIYELLAPAGPLPAEREALLAAFAAGLRAYRAQDWAAAASQFGRSLALDPDDGPSRLYLQRAAEYAAAPPPPAWDGVFVATHK
jgi:adenylate cyclase